MDRHMLVIQIFALVKKESGLSHLECKYLDIVLLLALLTLSFIFHGCAVYSSFAVLPGFSLHAELLCRMVGTIPL
jgi:hypothetical protein